MKPAPHRCASAACLLLVSLWTAPAWAQDQPPNQPPPKLGIVIVEGDGAINNLKDQTIHPPVIQVRDENLKPIAGAAVVFFLPTKVPAGPSSTAPGR